MSNSEYIKKGGGSFATALALDAPLSHFATTIDYTRVHLNRPDGIQVGMAAMVNDEIMRVETIGDKTMTVKRGCADTVPQAHPVDSVVWILNVGGMGTDLVERSAGESVGVKVSPYTTSGAVPSGSIPPREVDFNWRMFRPYPPAQMMVNDARWMIPGVMDDATPNMRLTWVPRDRVLQADQLIGHDEPGIGPEPGTSYTLRIFNPITDQVVRTEVGITGNEFLYRRSQALHDQGYPSEVVTTDFTFCASREGFESMQSYTGTLVLHPTANIESNYMAFEQRVVECGFVMNTEFGAAANGANAMENHSLILAARPSDRMVDTYDLYGPASPAFDLVRLVEKVPFTPWVTTKFRLPELETTLNIGASSYFDGVPPVGSVIMGLIDDEIVQIMFVTSDTVNIKRGYADTIPAVHTAGARLWLMEAAHAYDLSSRADNATLTYKVVPNEYGPPVDQAALPPLTITHQRRSERPWPNAQMVVNARPWFEEVQALSGSAIQFSWARRRRVVGGTTDHSNGDIAPDAGQITRLRFYYETPSPTPGEPAIVHVMRTVDTTGRTYSYPYNYAQADGDAAGRALGICGTVVISCRNSTVLDGLESMQSYVTPIRVPSYPC
jgi:hypothetical protein